MKVFPISAISAILAVAAPASAQNVPIGVYDCYGPSMAEGGVNPGRFGETYNSGAQASRLYVSGGKFAVIAPGQYLSRRGGKGRFSFDGHTLSMIDGPYAGLRYHMVSERFTMRMLRTNGTEGPIMCPRNTSKDPRQPNRW